MSSMVRSIRRGMVREAIQEVVQLGKLICPKCGGVVTRKSIVHKNVTCPKCAWKGRLK